MVACQVAWTLFRTPTKIARIRSARLSRSRTEAVRATRIARSPVDVADQPGAARHRLHRAADPLSGRAAGARLRRRPVRLVGVRALQGGALVGQQLQAAARAHPGPRRARRRDLSRRPAASSPKATRSSSSGDEVFFLAAREDIRAGDERDAARLEDPVRRVVIAGGGNIGFRLAQALEERAPGQAHRARPDARARASPSSCSNTIVLIGDAADEELLLEENIDSADVFVARHQRRRGEHPLGDARQAARLRTRSWR